MTAQMKNSGGVIDIRPSGSDVAQDARDASRPKTTTLLRTEHLEIVRLTIPAGQETSTHTAPGEVTIQCLEGRVGLTLRDHAQTLEAGQLLCLPARESYCIEGIEDGSLLLTILLPAADRRAAAKDDVQEASEESFPASDSPAWTGVSRP